MLLLLAVVGVLTQVQAQEGILQYPAKTLQLQMHWTRRVTSRGSHHKLGFLGVCATHWSGCSDSEVCGTDLIDCVDDVDGELWVAGIDPAAAKWTSVDKLRKILGAVEGVAWPCAADLEYAQLREVALHWHRALDDTDVARRIVGVLDERAECKSALEGEKPPESQWPPYAVLVAKKAETEEVKSGEEGVQLRQLEKETSKMILQSVARASGWAHRQGISTRLKLGQSQQLLERLQTHVLRAAALHFDGHSVDHSSYADYLMTAMQQEEEKDGQSRWLHKDAPLHAWLLQWQSQSRAQLLHEGDGAHGDLPVSHAELVADMLAGNHVCLSATEAKRGACVLDEMHCPPKRKYTGTGTDCEVCQVDSQGGIWDSVEQECTVPMDSESLDMVVLLGHSSVGTLDAALPQMIAITALLAALSRYPIR